MKKHYLFIANWKMRMHYSQAIHYCTKNKLALMSLSNNHSLVICPSFVALSHAAQLLDNTNIKLGAQDCSASVEGSYTGQVSAQSLREIGCSYCIIGHSERRAQLNETNESVAEKTIRLLENMITPIICIGESELDVLNSRTYMVLEEQLQPIFSTLHTHATKNLPLIFAYEPAWAIGTGVVPEKNYLIDIYSWLQKILAQQLPETHCKLLYGGSVDEKNIYTLKEIPTIDGFLIGGASADFKKFKAIIESD